MNRMDSIRLTFKTGNHRDTSRMCEYWSLLLGQMISKYNINLMRESKIG